MEYSEICGMLWNVVESMWNPCGIHVELVECCGIHMELVECCGIHVNIMESMKIMWNPSFLQMEYSNLIPSHSTWIPVEYSMISYGIQTFHDPSIWNECGKLMQNGWGFSQNNSI